MNAGNVLLTVVHGPMRRHEYVFEDGDHCVIGRAHDCELQLPSTEAHASISRHHCVLEVEWPIVRLRDLGSRNGTFLNGEKIGQRLHDELPAEDDDVPLDSWLVHDGDKIQVGHTVIRVSLGADGPQRTLLGGLTYVA